MGTNSMYKFPRVSEYRHFFYHTSQKSPRIKKWSIFLHFHCTGVIGDAGQTKRDLILGTDGQTYRDFIFWRDSNRSKMYNSSWALLCLSAQLCTAGSGLCPESAWSEETCSPLHCPWPVPWHHFHWTPCSSSSSKGLMCVFIQIKGLPWPLLRFLHFFFPSHASTGGHYPPLDLSTKHEFACKKHHRNSTGGQVLSKPIS